MEKNLKENLGEPHSRSTRKNILENSVYLNRKQRETDEKIAYLNKKIKQNRHDGKVHLSYSVFVVHLLYFICFFGDKSRQ